MEQWLVKESNPSKHCTKFGDVLQHVEATAPSHPASLLCLLPKGVCRVCQHIATVIQGETRQNMSALQKPGKRGSD